LKFTRDISKRNSQRALAAKAGATIMFRKTRRLDEGDLFYSDDFSFEGGTAFTTARTAQYFEYADLPNGKEMPVFVTIPLVGCGDNLPDPTFRLGRNGRF
jgi:hypothetical protein